MVIELLVTLTKDDLTAYVDGALDPIRAAGVAASIMADPKTAAAAAAYRNINDGLQALYGAIALEPVPAEMSALIRAHAEPAPLRRVG